MSATLPAQAMTDVKQDASRQAPPEPARKVQLAWADPLFALLAGGAAVLTLGLLVGIIISLIVGAWPAITEYGLSFLWRTEWDPVQDHYGGLVMI
jgi:phosphate transport system permease protein